MTLRHSSNWAANLFKIWQNSNAIFLGNTTHYFLELGDGSEVEAIQDSDVWEIIPNGTAVRLGVKEKKINVFSRDGSTPLVVREELL